jgi:hypothetical protein
MRMEQVHNQRRWWTFGGLLKNSALAGMLR